MFQDIKHQINTIQSMTGVCSFETICATLLIGQPFGGKPELASHGRDLRLSQQPPPGP